MMSDLARAVRLIEGAQRIAVACHLDPDPDAIGSLLGLGLALEEQGRQVAFLCDGPLRGNLEFLPGHDRIVDSLPADFKPELFIGLDSSDPQRLGEVSQPLLDDPDVPTLVIDHHATNLEFGDVNVVIVEAASTAEMVIYLLDKMTHPISQPVAECLMAGFLGDTVGFSVSSVTPLTMRLAGRLIEAGAELYTIHDRLFNSRSLAEVQLWGLGMANTQLEDGVLWSVLTWEDRQRRGLQNVSRSRLSNTLLSVREANIAVSFSETEEGSVEISMRARPGCDVGQVALELGGGGHRLASGCTIDGPLDKAVSRVVGLLKPEAAARSTPA